MLPKDAKVFPLTSGTKVPLKGTQGHLDAVAGPPPEGNYGISLDGQYVVVDFDRPRDEGSWELPETWTQKSRRGLHMLFRVPKGADLKAAKNRKFEFGDVKVRGYIVGPGSVVNGHKYEVIVDRDPIQAPLWLWEYVCSQPVAEGTVVADRDSISAGERDDSLARIGGLLRRMSLSQEAIAKGLDGINQVLVDPPVSAADIKRIARSVAKYDPSGAEADGPLRPQGWVAMDEVAYVGPPTRWWVRGFVPKGELVMLFGPGSVGKSSWGSWLASQVTQKNGRVAVVTVEEPAKRFAWRAQLNGAILPQILAVPKASSLLFPRDALGLKEALEATKTDLLYIDSIYSHFESVDGQNAAERARRCLAPLAEIAQETGVTIVAVFHVNKAGDYLGSVEMRNVPRYVLKAAREAPGPLYVSVDKTNLWDPGVSMAFRGVDVLASDPSTGEVQLEEDDEGNEIPMHFTVLERTEDVPRSMVDADQIEESKEGRIMELLLQDPDMSASKIIEEVGGRKQDMLEAIKGIKEALNSTGSRFRGI